MKTVITNFGILNKKLIKSTVAGIVIGISSIALLALLTSFILLKSGKYPKEYLTYISFALIVVGNFFGGYFSSKINKGAGLVVGALVGFFIFIILLAAGVGSSPKSASQITLFKLIACVIPSAVGGILSANKKEKIKIK